MYVYVYICMHTHIYILFLSLLICKMGMRHIMLKMEVTSNVSTVVWKSVLPKFVCWRPIPQGHGIRRWAFEGSLDQEAGSLMNGISVLIKETQERSLTPYTMWGHNEKSVTWKRTLTWPCQHPDIWLLGSRAKEIHFCCLWATECIEFCYGSLNRLIQSVSKGPSKSKYLC